MQRLKLIPTEYRLSFLFSSVEPVPESILLDWLEEKGFTEIKDIPKRIGTESVGIERLNIARRGTCQVIYDPSVASLGIAGRSYEEVLREFGRVESMLKEKGIDFLKEMRGFELTLEARVFAKGMPKPLESITKFLGTEKLSEFNEIVGAEVIPFCIRFCPKSEMETFENLRRIPKWFDFYIYPLIVNPNYYAIRAVFRDTDLSHVKKFAEVINDKILEMIKVILRRK
jgi:hypothetical protein